MNVGPEKALHEASGYMELGLWREARDVLESLSPAAKALPEVLA